MSLIEQKSVRIVAVCAALLVVSACGVKSSPGTPEGATYPRTYPAVSTGGQKATSAPKRATRTVAPDTYQPPPPATQLPR